MSRIFGSSSERVTGELYVDEQVRRRVTLGVAIVILGCSGYGLKRFQRHRSIQAIPKHPEPQLPADLHLRDIAGHRVSLSRFQGQVVLVNFWATWCTPCKVEIPSLIELQDNYGARGFTVIGIAMDDEGVRTVAPFVDRQRFDTKQGSRGINYPVVLGSDEAAAELGGVREFPTSLLFSKDGRQVKRIEGLLDYADVGKAVEALLANGQGKE